mmetsp:Transcript_2864/g.8698  ORF Transcript_2864/g.8698 Transcript_2864/m.8698 type:complete len:265 (-) Transcript_2864:3508-4302(-)
MRLLVQVEADGAVVQLHVRNLDQNIFERAVIPRVRRVVDHHHRRVVVLVVLAVQEGQLLPVLLLVARADEARDVDARGIQLDVLHQRLDLKLGVHDAQLGEDAHVRALQPQARLEQCDELVELALALVEVGNLVQLVGVHDDVQARHLRQALLALQGALKAHLLPRAHRVGLARGVHRRLELAQLDQRARQPRPVAHVGEEHLGRLVQALIVALVAARAYVRRVGHREELLQLAKRARLGEGVAQRAVDACLLDLFAHHLKVFD